MDSAIILYFIIYIIFQYALPIFSAYYIWTYVRGQLFGDYTYYKDHKESRKNISLYFGIFITIMGMIAAFLGNNEGTMDISIFDLQIKQATIGVVMMVIGVFLIVKVAADKG